MRTIPKTENSLLLRTDFSDETAWSALCAAIQAPVGEFQADVTPLSDPAFDGATTEELIALASEGEAIVRADGLVDRAGGEAATRSARNALRAAAVALDTARGDLRAHDADGALALWRSLVAARWSLVDEFDRRGRRYFIAHANDPPLADRPQLSRREQLVVEYAALGHSNKFIAYELGLGASTVATYLKRAMAKLHIGTRLELIERFSRDAR